MNKLNLKWILPGMVCIGLASCSKNYLNLTPPSQIPLTQAVTDENSMQVAVNGMYSSLRATDYFGRSVPIDGDLLADNIYIGAKNSNRYVQEMTYTLIAVSGDVQNIWADAYNTILRANVVINATLPADAIVNQLKGEALTARALSYFILVRFFGKPYLVDSTSLGVPLVLKFDPFAKPSRSTVAQVYQQIVSDLDQAYGLMTIGKNTSYFSKYVAGGLLSKVYLNMGVWLGSQNAALDVVNNGGYKLTTDSLSFSAFWNSAAPRSDGVETLFEVEFDPVDNNGTDALDAFYDQNGYGDALCTDSLYFDYNNTDVRRSLILLGQRAGQNAFIVNKYPNLSNPNAKDNTKILRYAEVLLTLAETYNHMGDDLNAQNYANQVGMARDTAFKGYTNTGAALLNDIINERRKELAFEGDRYWDFARLNWDVIRESAGNYLPSTPLTLLATDTKRIFPIPQAEINANKNVTQNLGY